MSEDTAQTFEARISQLEADLAEAVRWRDIYLRERNEERATFMRRAGDLWQPLYDHAMAELNNYKSQALTKGKSE